MITPVKIFSVKQVKEADRITILNEPVNSIDLMERAALKCVEWIGKNIPNTFQVTIFCGPGNNGGDGLAIARLLLLSGYQLSVFVIRGAENYSPDYLINEQRLQKINKQVLQDVFSVNDLPVLQKNSLVIDAIFGVGLSKPVSGLFSACIRHINQNGVNIVAIDMPSGLLADSFSSPETPIIEATYTLSFQFPKLAFLFPENEKYVGDWHILDIGLDKHFIGNEPVNNYLITKELVYSLVKPRKKFSHKGTFGHALLVSGSYGKMGAAVLTTQSCLRSGVGLVTVHVPKCGYTILQSSTPEAMVSVDENEEWIQSNISTDKFSSVGMGPGIGQEMVTQVALKYLLSVCQLPLVMDADALNILAKNKEWLNDMPANSVLTPHVKEFERMAGTTSHDFERHQLQLQFSKKYQLWVILKGAHTCITSPTGESFFNTTGNPGMAKAGSGDILTGLLTGLLAQGYPSRDACMISVFVHGLAGDLAKADLGEWGMTAADLIRYLPKAFLSISGLDYPTQEINSKTARICQKIFLYFLMAYLIGELFQSLPNTRCRLAEVLACALVRMETSCCSILLNISLVTITARILSRFRLSPALLPNTTLTGATSLSHSCTTLYSFKAVLITGVTELRNVSPTVLRK